MKLKNLLVAVAVSLLCTSAAIANPPKREMRSVWIAGMNIDWPSKKGTTAAIRAEQQQQLVTMLDNYRKMGLNNVCLHVRPRADAYYKSTLEPWSADLSGTRGKDPGWDPLAFAIEECHKRGMEIYAWVNPYRVNANGLTYTTDFDKQWEANGWLIRSGKWTSFNPGHPGARKHCFDVIKEIYTNYMIDGLLFDDYFYPGDQLVANNADHVDDEQYNAYKAQAGDKPMSKYDWRRENVNSFVRELYADIQQTRPGMRFGIGPAGVSFMSASRYGLSKPNVTTSDWQYDGIYADVLAWMADKSVDFVGPQLYWGTKHSTAPFEPLSKWWAETAVHFGVHNYISIGSYRLSGDNEYGGNNINGWNEIATQVDMTRRFATDGAPGQIYYNGTSINGNSLATHLQNNCYTAPALVPALYKSARVSYDAPAGLKRSGSALSWTATVPAPRSQVRYTVYAVPAGKTLADVTCSVAGVEDGISNEYLLGITYTPSYTIPADKTSGYWYAVCVYDGYGVESDPAVEGYSVSASQAATLLTPADAATAGWNQTFGWSAVENATYTLEIARDASFTDMFLNTRLTGTSFDVSFADCADGERMWWRVSTRQPGSLTARSDVRTFSVPVRQPASRPVAVAPAGDAEVEGNQITFKWSNASDTGIDTYMLEVCARGNDFAEVLLDATVPGNEKSYTVSASKLGNGEFEWRVTAAGATVKESASETVAFTVSGLSTGLYEDGYVVVTDGSDYEATGNLRLENLWFRSTKADFANMPDGFDGMRQRGMAATADGVYLSHRSENSISADLCLQKFDPFTGEHVADIPVDNTVAGHSYFPLNDVITDDAGHLVITNLTLNLSATPVYLYMVSPADGKLTRVASLTGPASYRIDHLGISGDVTSDEFHVFAAVAGRPSILRWTVTDGESLLSPAEYTASAFYPASSDNFGTAPKVCPMSPTQVYADGSGTGWSLYTLSGSRASMTASFSSADASLAPLSTSDNGGAVFTVGDSKYAVYNIEPAAGRSSMSSRYNIVAMPYGHTSFSGMSRLWTVPANGLGGTESSTCSAPVAVVEHPDKSAYIYVYSASNGLGCYRMYDTRFTGGIDDITADTAAPVRLYNLNGIEIPRGTIPAPGLYIRRTGTTATKVIIR